jgi:hypothetical protein
MIPSIILFTVLCGKKIIENRKSTKLVVFVHEFSSSSDGAYSILVVSPYLS